MAFSEYPNFTNLAQEKEVNLDKIMLFLFKKLLNVNLLIVNNLKYIGISNDTRFAPYTLVTSDLRRPSWHEKKSLFEQGI